MDEPIKILGVDDRPKNLLALEAVLEELDICFVKAHSGQEALEYVFRQEFALILLDVQMPEMDGFETASLIRSNKRSEHIPIIFVTAISFEKKHVFKGYDVSAVDYLFKPIDPNILRSKVKVFIELFRQKEKLKKKALELEQANLQILEQQKALKKSEIRFRTAFDQSFQFMAILDVKGKVLELNDLSCKACGSTEKKMIGRYLWDTWQFKDQEEKTALKHHIEKAAKDESTNDETVFYNEKGAKLAILRTISPVKDEFGRVIHISVQCQDITERKRAEEEKLMLETQLRQAQKMEALGTLAGGIAHDFNNILSVIFGYTDMARRRLSDNSPVHTHLSKIFSAAERARDLVKQILGFTRQTEIAKVPFQPSLLVKETIKLLRASIPATIQIQADIDPKCGWISADPTQFHQILLNLCTNAYHAMEYTGGRIDISLYETRVDESELSKNKDLLPGQYARLSVRDTGTGMDKDILEKIFDPYFTTKEIGKGTGMGLSIVHGIVKRHKGFILVESTAGEGSVFHIHFPIIKEKTSVEVSSPTIIPKGLGKICLIDDEPDFLEMAQDMMKTLGYEVIVIQNSFDALKLFQKNPEQFDLAVTDQIMPGMTGMDLALKMLEIRPGFPIILCTGYSQNLTKEKIRKAGLKEMLFKPLVVEDLSKAIQKALESEST